MELRVGVISERGTSLHTLSYYPACCGKVSFYQGLSALRVLGSQSSGHTQTQTFSDGDSSAAFNMLLCLKFHRDPGTHTAWKQ